MLRHSGWKRLILLLAVVAILLAVLPASAQDDAAAQSDAASEGPSGLGTLMLLLGVGAVVIVGGWFWYRERHTGLSDEGE
jgi:hypothetical protein